MSTVFVIDKNGNRLMPTTRCGKVKHMLKDGRAVIYSRHPFTIQLTYDVDTYTQSIEICQDTGYEHIGLSVKSESKEYVSAQYDLLNDEKEHHDAQRKYRGGRRGRKRHREPRFDNCKRKQGWLAPSLQHKADCHVRLIEQIVAVAPITAIYIEVGEFDTMALKAIENGDPLPEGKDYQQGPRYQEQTLRSAVFHRDNHTCKICGRGIKDGATLHAHHMLFWKGRHGNSPDEMITVCEKCHTAANHKEGGKLYGLDIKLPMLEGAAFMNAVRWYIYNTVKDLCGDIVHITYGAATKVSRIDDFHLEKSHVNDAYSMGNIHPAIRAKEEHFQKLRRNNRCLEKFYDAKYVDTRDGSKKSGAELGCERTKRSVPRNNSQSLTKYRGKKVSNGKRVIRTQRYDIRPGDVIQYKGKQYPAKGVHNNGTRVLIPWDKKPKSVAITNIKVLCHVGAWKKIS